MIYSQRVFPECTLIPHPFPLAQYNLTFPDYVRCDADRWSKQLDPLSIDASFMCASSAKNVNKRGLIPKKKGEKSTCSFQRPGFRHGLKKKSKKMSSSF